MRTGRAEVRVPKTMRARPTEWILTESLVGTADTYRRRSDLVISRFAGMAAPVVKGKAAGGGSMTGTEK